MFVFIHHPFFKNLLFILFGIFPKFKTLSLRGLQTILIISYVTLISYLLL